MHQLERTTAAAVASRYIYSNARRGLGRRSMDSQTTLKQPTRSRKLLVDMPAIIAKKKKATPVSRLRRALHQRLRQVPAQAGGAGG